MEFWDVLWSSFAKNMLTVYKVSTTILVKLDDLHGHIVENIIYTPRKLTKRDYFNRTYIFQPSCFRRYVSFQGCNKIHWMYLYVKIYIYMHLYISYIYIIYLLALAYKHLNRHEDHWWDSSSFHMFHKLWFEINPWCWWKKSCTSWYWEYPTFDRVSNIRAG